MIARMGLLTRRPDCTNEQFRNHWRNVHGPLAAKLPHLRAYEQNHIVRSVQVANCPIPEALVFDGVSKLWFDDYEAMKLAVASNEYSEVAADELNFMLPSKVVSVEQWQLCARSTVRRLKKCLKCISLLTRTSSQPIQDFQTRLRSSLDGVTSKHPGIVGCTQNIVIGRSQAGRHLGYNDLQIDSVIEFWFEGADVLHHFLSPETTTRASWNIHEFTMKRSTWGVDVHAIV